MLKLFFLNSILILNKKCRLNIFSKGYDKRFGRILLVDCISSNMIISSKDLEIISERDKVGI